MCNQARRSLHGCHVVVPFLPVILCGSCQVDGCDLVERVALAALLKNRIGDGVLDACARPSPIEDASLVLRLRCVFQPSAFSDRGRLRTYGREELTLDRNPSNTDSSLARYGAGNDGQRTTSTSLNIGTRRFSRLSEGGDGGDGTGLEIFVPGWRVVGIGRAKVSARANVTR